MSTKAERLREFKAIIKEIMCNDDTDVYEEDSDGVCPKCGTMFERPGHIRVGHPGVFCPVCREHGYTVVGVVHFTPDAHLNILPDSLMTA